MIGICLTTYLRLYHHWSQIDSNSRMNMRFENNICFTLVCIVLGVKSWGPITMYCYVWIVSGLYDRQFMFGISLLLNTMYIYTYMYIRSIWTLLIHVPVYHNSLKVAMYSTGVSFIKHEMTRNYLKCRLLCTIHMLSTMIYITEKKRLKEQTDRICLQLQHSISEYIIAVYSLVTPDQSCLSLHRNIGKGWRNGNGVIKLLVYKLCYLINLSMASKWAVDRDRVTLTPSTCPIYCCCDWHNWPLMSQWHS